MLTITSSPLTQKLLLADESAHLLSKMENPTCVLATLEKWAHIENPSVNGRHIPDEERLGLIIASLSSEKCQELQKTMLELKAQNSGTEESYNYEMPDLVISEEELSH